MTNSGSPQTGANILRVCLAVIGAVAALLCPIALSHAQHLVALAGDAAEQAVLDGRLDDPIWEPGPWYTHFTLSGEGLKAAEAQTRFTIAFGPTHLHFAAECFEPNMSKLVTRVTERDGNVFRDDCVELMLDPTGNRGDYYHLVVNPLGAVYDAQLTEGGKKRSTAWDCSPQVAAARGERSWTVEMAIPLRDLNGSKETSGDWAFNVARERKAGREELSSFVSTVGRPGFHQVDLYATLRPPAGSQAGGLWAVHKPFNASVRVGKTGAVLQARTVVANRGSSGEWAQLLPELITDSGISAGEAVPIRRKPGIAREADFSVPLTSQGKQVLRLRLLSRDDPPMPLRDVSVPLVAGFTPLTIDITRPYYRDSIYATEQIDAIAFTVALPNAGEAWLADKRLRARLCSEAEGAAVGDQVLVQTGDVQAGSEVRLTLPAIDLAVGDYQLVAELLKADGAVLWSARKRLRKLPPAPNNHEWRIDENNVLLHNGEPFLPFGWFSFAPRDKHAEDAYTALQSYTMEVRATHAARRILDTWTEKGLYGIFSPFSPAFKNRGKEVNGRPLSNEEAALLRERVRALMDHPAILAWYLYDEPANKDTLPSRVEQIYAVIRDTDPYHPCIVLDNHVSGIFRYARGCDIKMPDPYAYFARDGLAEHPIERVSTFMQAVTDATGGRKAAWVTPQAFNFGDPTLQRIPNFTELRNMMYQAVAHGCKGFLWYTYAHEQPYTYPELAIGVPFLSREARDLRQAILAPDVANAVAVDCPQPGHMHVVMRRAGAHTYLIAVNTATTPQEVTFRLERAPETLYVVSEGREVDSGAGAFSDTFPVYGTRIYTTDPALARRETLEGVEGRIAEAKRPQKRPGNLAQPDAGVRVAVSSGECIHNRTPHPGAEPHALVNGMTSGMRWLAGETGPGQWAQLTWPGPVTVGRVVIHTHNILACQVQVQNLGDREWTKVSLVTAGDGPLAPLTADFEPVRARSIRIVATEVLPNWVAGAIYEIEAYAE